MPYARNLISWSLAAACSLPATALAQNYLFVESASPFVDIASLPGAAGAPTVHTITSGGTDDGFTTVPIPFPFMFLGNTRTSAHVSTNGFLSFDTASATAYTNNALGTTSTPNDMIAFFWDDMSVPANNAVSSVTLGTAPNRVFVIQTTGMRRLGGSDDIDWQVWLYEGASGRFDVRSAGTVSSAFTGTTGYEGPNGTPNQAFRSCQPTCDATALTSLFNQVLSVFIGEDPELTGGFGAFPRGAFPGASAAGQIELRNLGIRTASVVQYQVYLSSDATLDGADALIATGTVAGVLGGNQPITVTTTVTVPNGLTAGDYTLLLFVDSDARFTETNELDNVVAGPSFATAYDLQPTSITSSDGANAGQPIEFEIEIRNNGVPRVGTVDLEIFASADTVYDSRDVLVHAETVTLAGNNTERFTVRGTLPSLPAGAYYPVVLVDPSDVLVELDEINNALTAQATFPTGPDFSVGAITAPNQVAPGAMFTVRSVIESNAVPFTGTVGYRIFLSADDMLDAGDTPLGDFVATFAGEDSVTEDATAIFPMSLAPNLYRVIVLVDPTSAISEVTETNNTNVSAATVSNAFDFAVGTVTVPASSEPGASIALTAQLQSLGNPFVGDLPYGVYLSSDNVFDPGDTLFHTSTVFVSGLSTTSLSTNVMLPRTTPIAGQYVIVVADPMNTIPESNERNNATASSGRVDVRGAELFIPSVDGPDAAFIGLPYPVTLTIRNDGDIDARDFRFTLHLSDNEFITVNDPQVFVSDSATVAVGGQQTFRVRFNMPTFTSTRSLFLGAVADTFSAVPERSESNNSRRKPTPIRVVFPIPNLSGAIVATATAAGSGEGLAITRIIRNDGVADASGFTYSYVLSRNPTLSSDDLELGRFTLSVPAGADDYRIDRVTVPSTALSGSFYIGLRIDPDDEVEEIDDTDNDFLGPQLDLYEATVQFITRTLPNATLGVRYEVGVYASGAGSAMWSVSGALPAGLSVDANTGFISGIPGAEGVSEFTLRATTGAGYAERSFSIRVVEPSARLEVATRTLPTAVAGRPYDVELIAVGGARPYRWSSPSTIPAGLRLDAAGRFVGAPSAPGNYNITLSVTDELGANASRRLALNIISPNQAVAITQLALPAAVVGTEYCENADVAFNAMGGLPPYTWSAVGDLPGGMTLGANGVFCGEPERTGEFPVLVRAQDSTGLYDTSLFILTVEDSDSIVLQPATLPSSIVNTPFAATLTAQQAAAPVSWEIVGALPPGVSLTGGSTVTTELSGTPTAAGVYSFLVKVTDARGRVAQRPLSIVVDNPPTLGTTDPEGCSCSTSGTETGGGSSALAALGLLALVGLRRRRGLGLAVAAAAAVSVLAPTAAQAQFMPVSGTPYLMQRGPHTYANLQGATLLFDASSNDDAVQVVQLPFTFRYYDSSFDSVTIGFNGALIMGSGGTLSDFNSTVGSTSQPNGYVAPFWDDLHTSPGEGGRVSYKIEGVAPQRRFVVEWRDLDRFSGTAPKMNFQVVLHEGPSGRLQVNYGPIGGSATINGSMGMEDPDGRRPIFFRTGSCTTTCNYAELSGLSGSRVDLIQDPGIELVALGASGPEFGFIGAPMLVRVVMANLHATPVGPFTFAVVMSRFEDLSNAITIHNSSALTFPAFQTLSTTIEAAVPAGLSEGEYYVGLIVDDGGTVNEVAEDNNRIPSEQRVRILTGKPDLAVTEVLVTERSAAAGARLDVYSTVRNVGATAVSNAAVGLMLSANPAITAQDVSLGSYMVSLAAGEAITTTTSVMLPAGLTSGAYFLGALADPADAVDELNESNNGRAIFQPIAITGGALAIVTQQLPQAYVDTSYDALLVAVGGARERRWTVASGRLPTGLRIVASSGQVFGRPQNVETQAVTIQVESGGETATANLTFRVVSPDAPLTVVSRSLPPAIVGQEYAEPLIGVGGTMSSTYTWSATGLPDGLTLSDRGLVMGTPSTAGTATIAVTLSDGTDTAMRGVQLTVRDNANLLIAPQPLPTATYREPYSFRLSASGGVPPLTWVLKLGTLPEGITLSPSGELSGTPERVGAFRVVVEVRDAATGGLSARDANTLELVVEDSAGFSIATTELPVATVNKDYSATLTTMGGTAPITWRIRQGRLPTGLVEQVVATTGDLSILGSASEAGVTNLLIEATDAHGRSAARAFALRAVTEVVQAAGPMEDEGCRCVAPRDEAGFGALALLALLGLVRRRRA